MKGLNFIDFDPKVVLTLWETEISISRGLRNIPHNLQTQHFTQLLLKSAI